MPTTRVLTCRSLGKKAVKLENESIHTNTLHVPSELGGASSVNGERSCVCAHKHPTRTVCGHTCKHCLQSPRRPVSAQRNLRREKCECASNMYARHIMPEALCDVRAHMRACIAHICTYASFLSQDMVDNMRADDSVQVSVYLNVYIAR